MSNRDNQEKIKEVQDMRAAVRVLIGRRLSSCGIPVGKILVARFGLRRWSLHQRYNNQWTFNGSLRVDVSFIVHSQRGVELPDEDLLLLLKCLPKFEADLRLQIAKDHKRLSKLFDDTIREMDQKGRLAEFLVSSKEGG